MKNFNITDSIKYVGVDDRDIDLFESQYVVPNGISYNSYVIFDEKITVMDTVDKRKGDEWLDNLKTVLDDKKPEYLVISHMEPDHASSIDRLVKEYPDMKLVGNVKTFTILGQFFDVDISDKKVVVNDGDELCLGSHTLKFVFAPMVHWPEVMLSYELSEKVLFSADAFGKFGALDADESWTCEARRYYFNIVGKYGAQVQTLLKKLAGVQVNAICPLHGPVLTQDLGSYIDLYNTWSSYEPETDGVFVAYASIHGNTAKAAEEMEKILRSHGVTNIEVADVAREDIAECVENCFRYSRIILMAASYDGGVFTPMHDLLSHLATKGFRNRKIALVENGSWGPTAARTMKGTLEGMKDITICDKVVTIRSAMTDANVSEMNELAAELLND